MVNWDIYIAIFTGVILFLYSIQHFSTEVQKVVGKRFKLLIARITNNRFKGAILGAGVSGLMQSSTATSILTLGLVNAGIITFVQSLGIIIGAHVGTTITAQLVAFKISVFAPLFIALGFFISLFGKKYAIIGQPLFYFGLVFFSLNFISSQLTPFQENAQLVSFLSSYSSVFLAIFAGFLFTALIQSSAVTIGLAVILAQKGFISLHQGIYLMLGANIGTTTTALLVALVMNREAKRTALAHFLFSFIGVLILLPFIGIFVPMVQGIGGSTANQIANAHTLFNILAAIFFLLTTKQFTKLLTYMIPAEKK